MKRNYLILTAVLAASLAGPAVVQATDAPIDDRIVYDIKGGAYTGIALQGHHFTNVLGKKGFSVDTKMFFGAALSDGAKVVAGFACINKEVASGLFFEFGLGFRLKTGAPSQPMVTFGITFKA